MSRTLTSYERETIISFNEGETKAIIFTYNRAWQKHLEKKFGLSPVMNNGYGGREYEIDKTRIKPPRVPIRLSAELKARKAKHLENVRRNRVLNRKSLITIKKSNS